MNRLITHREFWTSIKISDRGKQLPPGANDFTSFLQSYTVGWAVRAGIPQALSYFFLNLVGHSDLHGS
jgi:hypothetical protein